MNNPIPSSYLYCLEELEMRPGIYSKEAALAEYEKLIHTLELLKAEFIHQKEMIGKTHTIRGMENIIRRIEEIKIIIKKIMRENQCILMCMAFANFMEANKNLAPN